MYNKTLQPLKLTNYDYWQIKFYIQYLVDLDNFEELHVIHNYQVEFVIELIKILRIGGFTVNKIAGWLGISVRTVYRIITDFTLVSDKKYADIFNLIHIIINTNDYSTFIHSYRGYSL